jgi:malonate decarboxylase epsilon subunit
MSLAFLFPCQGSQRPAIVSRLAASEVKERYLAIASKVIGYEIEQLESEQALAGTKATQIALYVAGVIGSETLKRMGVRPFYCAGHSIGAFAAAVSCGALDFAAGLEIVQRRAALMQIAFSNGYGMGVIVGIDEMTCDRVTAELTPAGREIFVSVVNGSHQIVVTGKIEDVDAALAVARLKGARKAARLNVATTSHCVLSSDLAKELRRLFPSVTIRDPGIPYVANRNGRILRDGHEIWEDLIACLEFPVRWDNMSTALVEAGVSIFVEMPPGRTLSSLIRSAFPWAKSYAVDDHNAAWVAQLARYLSAGEAVAVPRADVEVW